MLSAEAYVQALDLDRSMVREIEDEMRWAASAWQRTIGDDVIYHMTVIDQQPGLQSILSKLMSHFTNTYVDQPHGQELREASSNGQLHKERFMDWYIRWLYRNDLRAAVDEDGEAVSPVPSSKESSRGSSPSRKGKGEWHDIAHMHPCEETHVGRRGYDGDDDEVDETKGWDSGSSSGSDK